MTTQILYVDDDAAVRCTLTTLLGCLRADCEVTAAEDGLQALAILRQQPFSMVISDLRMPGMNGAQFLAEVRESYPHLIRIICSGSAEPELIRQCAGLAHRWLSKPFSGVALCNVIRDAEAFIRRTKASLAPVGRPIMGWPGRFPGPALPPLPPPARPRPHHIR